MANAKNPPLSNLPLDDVSERCKRENALFLIGRDSDPRFCFELFRRALALTDQDAWHRVYAQYGQQVENWVRRSPQAMKLFSDNGMQDAVNLAFWKFSQAASRDFSERFQTLSQTLGYLRRCAATAVVDLGRREGRDPGGQPVAPLEAQPIVDPSRSPDQVVSDDLNRTEFWEQISSLIRNQQEQIVLHNSFLNGIKANEIYELHRDHFDSVQQVYRVKANLLKRLGRSKELKQFIAA